MDNLTTHKAALQGAQGIARGAGTFLVNSVAGAQSYNMAQLQ